MAKSAAMLSAVCGIECVSYCVSISGLTKRQPMFVSKMVALRAKADSALPMTKGARDMPSTPPAIISVASPALIERAARPMASMPEPHRRLIVVPGTDRQPGKQPGHARDVAVVLAGLVGAAEDDVVDGTPATRGLRSISALSGMAPRSSARTPESAPP